MPRDKSESAAAREEDTASTDPLGPEATAISMMLHDEGPLHGFQGPVLLLNPEQEVVAGNPAALSIIHGMIAGTQDRLTAFIGTAFSGSVT